MDPQPPAPQPSLLDPQLLWATIALVATLLLAAVIFAWVDRWRKRLDRETSTPADQLTVFRLSYEQGELSQEEYERIRARLAPQMKQPTNVPGKPKPEASRERQPPESARPTPEDSENYFQDPPDASAPNSPPNA
jgi:hypothetical protein